MPPRRSLAQLISDRRGQELIEYALLAALIALAAGAILPGTAASISSIHSRIAHHASRVAGF